MDLRELRLGERAVGADHEASLYPVAAIRLDLPDLLRTTFRSTNPIESMFDKVKARGRRVKNWNADNQLARWSASALLLHQKKFRRIKGYRQLPKMIASLQNLAVDKDKAVA